MMEMPLVSRWPAHGRSTALTEATSAYIVGSQPQLTEQIYNDVIENYCAVSQSQSLQRLRLFIILSNTFYFNLETI